MKDRIKAMIEEKDLDITLEEWQQEFDYVYRNPEDISEFDEELEESDKKQSSPVDFISNSYSNSPIQISVIGRPNVGKSSLVNNLLVDNRLIVSNIPGTTRDSIKIHWEYKVKLHFNSGKENYTD